MVDTFISHDIFMHKGKQLIKSDTSPLHCFICKKELNGNSITAKSMKGKLIFLCGACYKLNNSKGELKT